MQTIALIGATAIAEQIASAALRANLRVIIDDVSDSRLQAISANLNSISSQNDSDVRAQHCCAPGPQDQSDSPPTGLSSLSAANTPIPNLLLTQSIDHAIRSADFLIDTLPDDLEVKLELFTLFDKFAKPNAIFITTGSIPIDDLAAITFCPDRCLAVRLTAASNAPASNDPAPTFHLVPARQTSPSTLAKCTTLFLHSFAFPPK